MERGHILASQTLAFKELIGYALENQVTVDKEFPALLAELIASRPSAFADAMATHKKLLQTVSQVLVSGFEQFRSSSISGANDSDEVEVTMRCADNSSEAGEVRLPKSWLLSAIILLSVWPGETSGEQLSAIVDCMLQKEGSEAMHGLASAKLSRDESSVVSNDLVSIVNAL